LVFGCAWLAKDPSVDKKARINTIIFFIVKHLFLSV
jgi:hypothetical protein